MGNAHGSLSWNLDEIAKALKISPEAVHEYFTDGRRVSFILERRIATEVLHATLAHSEGAGYDLIDLLVQNGKSAASRRAESISVQAIWLVQADHLMNRGFLRSLKKSRAIFFPTLQHFPMCLFGLWSQRQ